MREHVHSSSPDMVNSPWALVQPSRSQRQFPLANLRKCAIIGAAAQAPTGLTGCIATVDTGSTLPEYTVYGRTGQPTQQRHGRVY